NILDTSARIIRRHRESDTSISYNGDDIARDMLQAYLDTAGECELSYTNSNGDIVQLGFVEVTARAFRLSFDPYHCAELRWGAKGEELNSCQMDSVKWKWYENEQFLRNQIERRYEDRMGFTVEELTKPGPGNGVIEPPVIDVVRFLESGTDRSHPSNRPSAYTAAGQ
ncbi:MAG: hypothetical protein DWQ08_05680, partial [Proteobacteria bacterium]